MSSLPTGNKGVACNMRTCKWKYSTFYLKKKEHFDKISIKSIKQWKMCQYSMVYTATLKHSLFPLKSISFFICSASELFDTITAHGSVLKIHIKWRHSIYQEDFSTLKWNICEKEWIILCSNMFIQCVCKCSSVSSYYYCALFTNELR